MGTEQEQPMYETETCGQRNICLPYLLQLLFHLDLLRVTRADMQGSKNNI